MGLWYVPVAKALKERRPNQSEEISKMIAELLLSLWICKTMMWISLILLLETEISNKRENLWET